MVLLYDMMYSTMASVAKTSISLKPHNWEKLSHEKNRSVIINKALDLYFQRESFLQKAEQDWMHESIAAGLQDVERGNVHILNKNGKKPSKKQIVDFLHAKMSS